MPSRTIPPEVWSRIFFFVAPPLPFVGMECESLAEDAKVWRGDDRRVKGRWRDIDNLMLVSKRINELVSPVFWSYLVLKSAKAITELRDVLRHQMDGWPLPEACLLKVKVLELSDNITGLFSAKAEAGKDAEAAVLAFLRCLPNLVHIHLAPSGKWPTALPILIAIAARSESDRPLEGLSGLAFGRYNFDAVMLAIRMHAPSLRRLAIDFHHERHPDAADFPYEPLAIKLLALRQLAIGTYLGIDNIAIEMEVGSRCDMPALTKIVLGQPEHEDMPIGNLVRWTSADHSLDAVFYQDLSDVAADSHVLAERSVRELAFGIRMIERDETVVLDFKEVLDGLPAGQISSVKVVVVVEGRFKRASDGAPDVCLVELVSRKRLPSLEKVVWVAARKDSSDATWSGYLLKWTHELVKAGVVFEMQ